MACKSHYWIGFIVLAFVIGNLIGLPFWLIGSHVLKKKRAWTFMSLLFTLSILLLWICQEGFMIAHIVVFFIIGMILGGWFLQRTIMADIIDFGEFLTRTRNEALYISYKKNVKRTHNFISIAEFFPKIILILVTILPITFVGLLDYKQPIDGIPQPQEDQVGLYFQCVIQTNQIMPY